MRGPREALIIRHLPLARRLALRYADSGQASDDLIQVASLALVKAVDRWEPERGLAFSTYAVPTILGELRRYFRDLTWDVRPPREVQDLCLAIKKARDELGEADAATLASHLDCPTEAIEEALQAARGRRVESLEAVVATEDEEPRLIGDLMGTVEAGYDRAEDRAMLDRLTAILDAPAREILRLRFEDDLLQGEIADRVGISQVSVSRTLRGSLEKLTAYVLAMAASTAAGSSSPSYPTPSMNSAGV